MFSTMEAFPGVDSFVVCTLLAEHLWADSLCRLAQVSKALRVAADSDDSWRISYGVSKAERKEMFEFSLSNVARAKDRYRKTLQVLLQAEEHVLQMTNKLARAVIVDNPGSQWSPLPPYVVEYVGYLGGQWSCKHAAASSWEESPEVQSATCQMTVLTECGPTILTLPTLRECKRDLSFALAEHDQMDAIFARDAWCLRSH